MVDQDFLISYYSTKFNRSAFNLYTTTMSRTIPILILVLIILVGLIWFIWPKTNESVEESPITTEDSAPAAVPADGEYNFVASESKVGWRGSKTLIASYEDLGQVEIEQGSFTVSGGTISEGSVVFDMDSLSADTTSNTRFGVDALVRHLKSEDFLEVETYPTASFTISEPAVIGAGGATTLVGDLMIKGQTGSVMIPTRVTKMADGTVAITGDLSIDRTNWGIRYNSSRFFQDLGDNVIDDEVQIKIEAVAEPTS